MEERRHRRRHRPGQGHQPRQRSWLYPSNLTNVNGTLFFSADDGTNGSELWKSDGTAAGTVLVKDIRPGSQRLYPEQPDERERHAVLRGRRRHDGPELWKSDGTAAGTVLVKDINPGGDRFVRQTT